MEIKKLTDDQKVIVIRDYLMNTINSLESSLIEKPTEMGDNFASGQFVAIVELRAKYKRVFQDMLRFVNDEPQLPPMTQEEFSKEMNF